MHDIFIKQLRQVILDEYKEINSSNETEAAASLGMNVSGLKDIIDGKAKRTFKSLYEKFELLAYELVIEKDSFIYVGDAFELANLILEDYSEDFHYKFRNEFVTNTIRNKRSFNFRIVNQLTEMGFKFYFRPYEEY